MRTPTFFFLIGGLLLSIQLFSNGIASQVFLPTSTVPISSKPAVSHSPSPRPSPSLPATSSSFSPIIPLPSSSTSLLLSSSSSIVPTSSSILPSVTTPSSTLFSSSSSSSSFSSSDSLSSTISPTLPPTTAPKQNNSEPSTPTIVGAVVGGVVGLALLGGILTWVNRRGGCTSKTNQRKANFEDFGLAERDFPHHRAPAATGNSSSGFGGSTVVASPTLPRLNDQGTYYNDATTKHYQQQQQGDYDATYQDGSAYYYPPQNYPSHTGYEGGGYYDEHGYYYATGYDPTSQQQYQHQHYSPSMPPHSPGATNGTPDAYKPNANYR